MTRRKSYQFGALLGIPWRSARYVLRPARFLDSALGATLYGRWTLRAWSVNRALSSAGEHRLHTAGVAGSNPAAPTIFSLIVNLLGAYRLTPKAASCALLPDIANFFGPADRLASIFPEAHDVRGLPLGILRNLHVVTIRDSGSGSVAQ